MVHLTNQQKNYSGKFQVKRNRNGDAIPGINSPFDFSFEGIMSFFRFMASNIYFQNSTSKKSTHRQQYFFLKDTSPCSFFNCPVMVVLKKMIRKVYD